MFGMGVFGSWISLSQFIISRTQYTHVNIFLHNSHIWHGCIRFMNISLSQFIISRTQYTNVLRSRITGCTGTDRTGTSCYSPSQMSTSFIHIVSVWYGCILGPWIYLSLHLFNHPSCINIFPSVPIKCGENVDCNGILEWEQVPLHSSRLKKKISYHTMRAKAFFSGEKIHSIYIIFSFSS